MEYLGGGKERGLLQGRAERAEEASEKCRRQGSLFSFFFSLFFFLSFKN
jgi:hypothetical protein